MAPKVKKDTPAPPKAEAKAQALRAKKAVLKCIHSHRKKKIGAHHPPDPGKGTPRRNKPDHYAIIRFSLTTTSAKKKTG